MTYNYPTENGIKYAMEQGWSKEQAERGFEIFNFDGLDIFEIILRAIMMMRQPQKKRSELVIVKSFL